MYEENNAIVIKAALPGIRPEDLKIEVRENFLTISGQTQEESNHKEGDYLLNKRGYGQIRRSVTLPCEGKVDQTEAEFEDGLLTLTRAGTIPLKKIALKPKVKKDEPK
jgi:HSP20 family protein